MNLVNDATAPVSLAKPALRAACVRRRVIGVDIWAKCPLGSEQVVTNARSAATNTYLRLVDTVNETGLTGNIQNNTLAQLKLRFLARRDDVHVTDDAIWELLNELAGQIEWSKLVKLEEFDGVPAFAPLSPK